MSKGNLNRFQLCKSLSAEGKQGPRSKNGAWPLFLKGVKKFAARFANAGKIIIGEHPMVIYEKKGSIVIMPEPNGPASTIRPSLNRRSKAITEGDVRAPNRSMLRAVGLTDDDFTKPLTGIASTWSEITTCN